MNTILLGLFKLIIPLILMVFGETYYFQLLTKLGLSLDTYSSLVISVLSLLFYILVFILVYFLFKDDLKNDFKRFKRNLFPNVLMVIVFFIVITLGLKITDYLVGELSNLFESSFQTIKLTNIFTERLNISLIIYIIKNIILIPSIHVITIILGVNNLVTGKKKSAIFAGLLGALVHVLFKTGTISYLIFSSIPYLVLYIMLSYIYRRNNSNIFFSKLTIIFYTLLGALLLEKIS